MHFKTNKQTKNKNTIFINVLWRVPEHFWWCVTVCVWDPTKKHTASQLIWIYRKVANSSLSQLVARFQIFRRLMKGKFDAYVLWPLFKKFQNWIVDRSTARDVTVNDLKWLLNDFNWFIRHIESHLESYRVLWSHKVLRQQNCLGLQHFFQRPILVGSYKRNSRMCVWKIMLGQAPLSARSPPCHLCVLC